jgi:hypothetical protein
MGLVISKGLTLRKGYIGTDDPDAEAYIAAVEAADLAADPTAEPLETATKVAIHSFVKGAKADGFWPAIKASCILAGARTLQGALVPLVGAAPTNFNFVSGDYNRKTGLAGNGINKYLRTGLSLNDVNIANASISCWITDAHTGLSAGFVSAAIDSRWLLYLGRYSAGSQDGVQTGFESTRAGLTLTSRIGFHALSASALNNRSYFFDGQNVATNTTVEPLQPSNTLYTVFRTGEAVEGQFSNPRIAFFHIGTIINAQNLLYARVTDLINAFGAAIP